MSISDTTETAIMSLIFNATAWGNYADNAVTSAQANIACALHTADPTDSGNMSSSEIGYTGYLRLTGPARTSGGWTVTGNSVSPVAAIAFAAGSGGSGTASFFSTGKTGGGAAAILFSGSISPAIVTGNGVTPQLSTATAITID